MTDDAPQGFWDLHSGGTMKVYFADLLFAPAEGATSPAVWVVKANAALPVDSVDLDSPPIPSYPDGGWKRFTPNPDRYWTVKLVSGQTLTGKNNIEFIRVAGSLS